MVEKIQKFSSGFEIFEKYHIFLFNNLQENKAKSEKW